MRKKSAHQPRTTDDYINAADNALELAKVLAGQGQVSDQDFLERMACSDDILEHDGMTCGHCCYAILGAQIAREMIEDGKYEDVVNQWDAEMKKRWEQTKFFKLWIREQKAGRDPHRAFKDRGWEP